MIDQATRSMRIGILVVLLGLAGCTPLLGKLPGTSSNSLVAPEIPTSQTAVGQVPADASPQLAAGQVGGTVLTQDGNPASGINVTAYLVSNNAAGLTTNTGGPAYYALEGLTQAAGRPAPGAAGLRRLQSLATTVTDANGRFTFTPTATGDLGIEAVASVHSKAFKDNVLFAASTSSVAVGTMNLAPTGNITGRITASQSGGTVIDLMGIEIFIPGSDYVAQTDSGGDYTIPDVAVGNFTLVAELPQSGTGTIGGGSQTSPVQVSGVAVQSNATTSVPDIVTAK